MNLKAIEKAHSKWPVFKKKLPEKIVPRSAYQYYVDWQIVITGRRGEIEPVVAAVNQAVAADAGRPDSKHWPAIEEKALATINLATMVQPDHLAKQHPALAGWAGLEIRLYDLIAANGDRAGESEAGTWAIIRLVHEKAAELGYIVLADPNLIVGNPSSGGAGGVTGGPFSKPLALTHPDTQPDPLSDECIARFWDQWAFQAPYGSGPDRRKGINLEKAQAALDDPNRRFILDTGAQTQVFVLDTADAELLAHQPVKLPGQDLPLPLSVFDVRPRPFQLPEGTENISAHGRFICGLLNRVAPQAEIQLLRVLDDSGRGELFTLSCALLLVAGSRIIDTDPADPLPLSNTVVNLSLTADLSEDRILMEGVRRAIDQLWARFDGKCPESDVLYRLLRDIYNKFYYGPSLRLPIQLLKSLGAVIVASSGNESADRYGNLPAQVPARYPEVIGVGASNFAGQLSSFSNSASILAPGGGHGDPECPILDLESLAKQAGDLKPYALYSLVPKTFCADGLAYWWGTSFAAPLVTGLAALVQQKYRTLNGRGAEPDEVVRCIQQGAQTGTIDVDAALKAVGGQAKPGSNYRVE